MSEPPPQWLTGCNCERWKIPLWSRLPLFQGNGKGNEAQSTWISLCEWPKAKDEWHIWVNAPPRRTHFLSHTQHMLACSHNTHTHTLRLSVGLLPLRTYYKLQVGCITVNEVLLWIMGHSPHRDSQTYHTLQPTTHNCISGSIQQRYTGFVSFV